MSDQTLLKTDVDVESGSSEPLHPTTVEPPDLRWSFIRKVFSIVAMQLLFTTVVGTAVVSCHPLVTFITTTVPGLVCYVIIILSPIITLWPLFYYSERHPVNYVLLGIFNFGFSFAIGVSCSFTSARVILEALILTSAVVVCLTLFTFWAAKKDYEFWSFLLCGAIVVLIVAPLIQIFVPLVKISMMLYAGLFAIIFSACIIIDIQLALEQYTYDEYIWAALMLYIDIIRLFGLFLRIFSATERE